MLPWFISLLILLGCIQTPEEWNTLTPAQQEHYIIIGSDVPL